MFCGDVIMNMKKMGIILGTTLIALQAGTAQAGLFTRFMLYSVGNLFYSTKRLQTEWKQYYDTQTRRKLKNEKTNLGKVYFKLKKCLREIKNMEKRYETLTEKKIRQENIVKNLDSQKKQLNSQKIRTQLFRANLKTESLIKEEYELGEIIELHEVRLLSELIPQYKKYLDETASDYKQNYYYKKDYFSKDSFSEKKITEQIKKELEEESEKNFQDIKKQIADYEKERKREEELQKQNNKKSYVVGYEKNPARKKEKDSYKQTERSGYFYPTSGVYKDYENGKWKESKTEI